MNKNAVNKRIEERHLNLTSWCKSKKLSYPTTYTLLRGKAKRVMETRGQMAVIEALIADGLYVPDEDESVSVSDREAA